MICHPLWWVAGASGLLNEQAPATRGSASRGVEL
jgi:hypothetical protein